MKFAEALAADPGWSRGPSCSICDLLADPDFADRDDLAEALASDLAHTVIERALTNTDGVTIGKGAVGRHRRGDCKGAA